MRCLLTVGLLPFVTVASLLVPPLAAQVVPTHISPRSAANGLGNGTVNINMPFAWMPVAYQQLHDVGSFTSSQPAVFNKMSLRMSSGFAGRAGHMIDVELSMAHAPHGPGSASGTFAANEVASTKVNVFARKWVSLPTVPTYDWLVTFPFDVSFVYVGVTHVTWSATVWGNSNNNQLFTYPLDSWKGDGTSVKTGSYGGCQAAHGTRVATQSVDQTGLKPGATANFTGLSWVASGGLPAFLTIGASSTSYGGVPLPFDLTPLGAPGCLVTNDVLLAVPGVTQATNNGRVILPLAFPADPGLSGGQFHSQLLFLAAAANALGLFSSNGQTNTLGTPPGLARVFASGTPTATSGTVHLDVGLSVGWN